MRRPGGLTRKQHARNFTEMEEADGEAMRTLHVAPGDSAGGSLRQAIRDAGRDEEVLRCRDDLSCGPIESDDRSARMAWWARFHGVPAFEDDFETFWNRVTTTDDRLVVWFGRHSAPELAFFLAMADRLGDRSYDIVDVTGARSPAVSLVLTDRLRALLGTERPITAQEREEARRALAPAAGGERALSCRNTNGFGFGAGRSLRSFAD
jgi:hypothetical protein